ncbi:MAG: hypothetical protein HC855_08255 [Rhizobiales bacterium]|nr:hypothetical protein [Hyphomicrobiales bacterium]
MARRKTLALALVLTSAWTAPALASPESEAMIRDLIAAIDSSATWNASTNGISSSGSKTIVDGLTISLASGGLTFSGNKLELEDLSPGDGGGATLSSFMLDTFSAKFPEGSLSVEKANGHDLSFPSLSGWAYDEKQPATSIARLYSRIADVAFKDIVFPRLDAEIGVKTSPSKPQVQTITYEDLRYEGMSKGKLALNSVARIAQTIKEGDGPAVQLTWNGMVARNFDWGAFVKITDPDAYPGGKGDPTWRTGLESAEIGKLTATVDGAETFSIGSIKMGAMDIRQPERPFLALYDTLLTKGPDLPEAEMATLMRDNFSGLVGWFRFNSFEMSDLKGTLPTQGTIALQSAAFENLSSDGLGKLKMSGFDVKDPDFMASLAAFELADVTWPKVTTFFDIGLLDQKKRRNEPLDQQEVARLAGEIVSAIPRVGRMEFSGLSTGIPGTAPFSLKRYMATSEGGSALFPKRAEGRIEELVIPEALLMSDPQAREVFTALGYNSLTIDLDGAATHDAGSGAYDTKVTLGTKEAGKLKLDYAIGGLTEQVVNQFFAVILSAPPQGDPDPAQIMAAMAPLTFDGLTLRFEDASLTKRLVGFAAKMQGMDENSVKANATALATLGLSQLKSPELMQQVTAAIGGYLGDPKSFTISIKPQKPLGLMDFMALNPNDPAAAVNLLGVSVRAND